MAESFDLHNSEQTRTFISQGLWLQCAAQPTAASAAAALGVALELANADDVIPPIGLIADVNQLVFAVHDYSFSNQSDLEIAGLSTGWQRRYEDHVLGKILSDPNFERAAEAFRRLQGRDLCRGMAYLLNGMLAAIEWSGAIVNPAALRSLLNEPAGGILAEGRESCAVGGIMPELLQSYETIIAGCRRTGELVSRQVVFELERGTALSATSQRLAMKHIFEAVQALDERLPQQRPRTRISAGPAPTQILTEDVYPVGGFASLSNKGTIESLLHSQLAFMENSDRPDLFDVKFLRDELLYYARDENTFFRRRRSYVIALFEDLAHARCKDFGMDHQRIIMLTALLYAAVYKLSHWLTDESLRFDIVFVGNSTTLGSERELLGNLFREQVERSAVGIETANDPNALVDHCALRARQSQCHCLVVTGGDAEFSVEDAHVCRLRIGRAIPEFISEGGEVRSLKAESAPDAWIACANRLLEMWV